MAVIQRLQLCFCEYRISPFPHRYVCFPSNRLNNPYQNKIGETALHAAAWRGHPECVRLLLDAGANPRIRNQQRQLPIEIAKDAETAALLDSAMKADTCNAEAPNEYESESDHD